MDDEKLINAVRIRPFIYTKTDKNHSNRDMLSAAWDSIAQEVGENVATADCRCRWASLRDHFRKKHRELTTAAPGQAANKRRKWYLYDYLTFLEPTCSTGATAVNIKREDEDGAASPGDENPQASPLSVQSDEGSLPVQNSPPSSKRIKKFHRNSKRKEQLSALDKEVLQALKEPEKEADENELFFKSLLPAMKSLDLIQTLELRSEIQLLVLSYMRSGRSGTTAAEASDARRRFSTSKSICCKCNAPSNSGLLTE